MSSSPNFFILGAAKAGTTTLYEMLKQHPQIFLPFSKEPTFFNNDIFFSKGWAWYCESYFKGAEKVRLRGEATPHYLYWAEKTAPRIQEIYGDQELRFIVTLREPVSRAYSWYWNMVREGQEALGFEEALAAEEERLKKNAESLYTEGQMTYGYLRGGHYDEQIKIFLKYFPRKNFFFVLYDDLISDFSAISAELLTFLGLDPEFAFEAAHGNRAKLSRSTTMQQWLRDYSPVKDTIKKIISPKFSYALKEMALKFNQRSYQYPPLSPNLAKTLKEKFVDSNLKLAKTTGLDLSRWAEREN